MPVDEPVSFQVKFADPFLGGIHNLCQIHFSAGILPEETPFATAIKLRPNQPNVMRIEVPKTLEQDICSFIDELQPPIKVPEEVFSKMLSPSTVQVSKKIGVQLRTLLAVPAKITVIEAKGEEAKAE